MPPLSPIHPKSLRKGDACGAHTKRNQKEHAKTRCRRKPHTLSSQEGALPNDKAIDLRKEGKGKEEKFLANYARIKE